MYLCDNNNELNKVPLTQSCETDKESGWMTLKACV